MRGFLFFLLLTIFLPSCDKTPHLYEKYYGIYIGHYGQRGSCYRDSSGSSYVCFYFPTVITNDSLVPVHVRLNFPKEFYQTNNSDSVKYKVFLLSDSMGKEFAFGDYHFPDGKLKKFFDGKLENLFRLDTVLKPKEACTVYMGIITKSSSGARLSLFSRGHKPHFSTTKFNGKALNSSLLSIPDSAINKFILPTDKSLSLFLGVGRAHYKYYNIIPCGEVSYSN